MNREFWQELSRVREEFSVVAMATIVQTWGSTPRKAGAKIVICPDGRIFGTIGGGCSEGEVKAQAKIVMDLRKPILYTVSMVGDVAADEGMVCGGKMNVYIEPVLTLESMEG